MAAATVEVNLVYGQWTQVAPINEYSAITPQVQKCKLLVRYQALNPGVPETKGHEVYRTDKNKNIFVGASTTFATWVRPIEPATDVVATVTRF